MFGNDRGSDRHKAVEFGIGFDNTGDDYRRPHNDRFPDTGVDTSSAASGKNEASAGTMSELGISFDGKYYCFEAHRFERFTEARDCALFAQDRVSNRSD